MPGPWWWTRPRAIPGPPLAILDDDDGQGQGWGKESLWGGDPGQGLRLPSESDTRPKIRQETPRRATR